MPEDPTIEERVDELEREMARVKRCVGGSLSAADWIDSVSGSMKQFPEFDEVVDLGAEFRRSQADPSRDRKG